jgi:CHAD domain-containing protein
MAEAAEAPFRKRLDAFIKGAKCINKGDVEALHETRVASRRLRELIPLLALDHDTSGTLCRQLGKVTKQLGKVRELDVLGLAIAELSREGGYSSTVLKQLSENVETEQTVARERLAAKLPPETLKRIAAKLRRVAKCLESDDRKTHPRIVHGPRQPWLLALDARVARRATDLRSAIEAAGAVYVPERLHEVRIALKKLRYAAELVAEARPQRATAAIGTLRTAQDLLGRLHDRQVLIERARFLEASASPSALTASKELESLAQGLEVDCRRLHAQYMRSRAMLIAIADRMGGVHSVHAASRRVAS